MESGWFVVIGAIVGALPGVIFGWMSIRSAKDRQLRQMALEAALAEFKMHSELIIQHGRGNLKPPSAYFAPAYLSVLALMANKLKPTEIEAAYKKMSEMVKANSECLDTVLPKRDTTKD